MPGITVTFTTIAFTTIKPHDGNILYLPRARSDIQELKMICCWLLPMAHLQHFFRCHMSTVSDAKDPAAD